MIILGIGGILGDAASAIVKDGQLAAALADRFSAHLVGLYAVRSLYHDIDENPRSEAETTRVLFEEIVSRRSLSAEWRTASGFPADEVVVHGRYADLTILGQLDPDDVWSPLLHPRPEEVALAAGRPVLVVPYVGTFTDIGRRILVAWDASREATRAVKDAMPLLVAASSVTVMTIDAEQTRVGHGEVPGADIALHLARHGVTAQVDRTVSAGIGIGNTLLSRASDLEADLLVMGAYGHSRVRELLLGGVTRTVLASTTLPVLMAH